MSVLRRYLAVVLLLAGALAPVRSDLASRALRGGSAAVTRRTASARAGWEDKDRPPALWWQGASGMMGTVAANCYDISLEMLIDEVPKLPGRGFRTLSIQSVYDSGTYGQTLWCGLGLSEAERFNQALCPDKTEDECQGLWDQLVQTCIDNGVAIVSNFNAGFYSTDSPDFKSAEVYVKNAVAALRTSQPGLEDEDGQEQEWTDAVRGEVRAACAAANDKRCPGLWFSWAPLRWGGKSKPANETEVVGMKDTSPNLQWIRDDDAQMAYVSVWAGMPGTNFEYPEWTEYITGVLKAWAAKGVDGFMFDDPTRYPGMGEYCSPASAGGGSDTTCFWTPDSSKMKEVTDAVRTASDQRTFQAAELYGEVEYAIELGFDSLLQKEDYGASNPIINKVYDTSYDALEDAFTGAGSLDAAIAQCYFTMGRGSRWCVLSMARQPVMVSWLSTSEPSIPVHDSTGEVNSWDCGGTLQGDMSMPACFQTCAADENCNSITVSWQSTDEVSCSTSPAYQVEDCAWAIGEGKASFLGDSPKKTRLMLALSTVSGLLPTVDMWGNDAWWSNDIFPGADDQDSWMLDLDTQVIAKSLAFKHTSLRQALAADSPGYAVLRYDALYSGEVTITTFNFDAEDADANIYLYDSLVGQTATDMQNGVPWQLDSTTTMLSLPGYGYRALKLDEPWPVFEFQTTDMCTEAGDSEQTTLAGCFIKCIDMSVGCEAVNIKWLSNDAAEGKLVMCFPLAAASCTADSGTEDAWSYFTRKP